MSKYRFGTKAEEKVHENDAVTLSLKELLTLIDEADKALDRDSNDAEHDALYSIRESLAEMSLDPERRYVN